MKRLLSSLAFFALGVSVADAKESNQPDLIVHEWGTFTSVVSSYGESVMWSPSFPDPLPSFVHDLQSVRADPQMPPGILGKGMASYQRMETPVVYFYADQSMRASVSAGGSSFTMTEWYPQARASKDPLPLNGERMKSGQPGISSFNHLTWRDIEILHPDAEVELPDDGSDNHYYPARSTAANPLQIQHKDKEGNVITEREKFLFYRGNSSSEAPYRVHLSAPDGSGLYLEDREGAPIGNNAWVLQVQEGRARLLSVAEFQANQAEPTRQINLPAEWSPLAGVEDSLHSQIERALLETGLYPDEAAAMIATWKGTWFRDEGMRVLYLMPEQWVENQLALKVHPEPAERVRVMVGRIEIITPDVAWKVTRAVSLFADEDPVIRDKGRRLFKGLKLGRFADMAIGSSLKQQQGVVVGSKLARELDSPKPVSGDAEELAASGQSQDG